MCRKIKKSKNIFDLVGWFCVSFFVHISIQSKFIEGWRWKLMVMLFQPSPNFFLVVAYFFLYLVQERQNAPAQHGPSSDFDCTFYNESNFFGICLGGHN